MVTGSLCEERGVLIRYGVENVSRQPALKSPLLAAPPRCCCPPVQRWETGERGQCRRSAAQPAAAAAAASPVERWRHPSPPAGPNGECPAPAPPPAPASNSFVVFAGQTQLLREDWQLKERNFGLCYMQYQLRQG